MEPNRRRHLEQKAKVRWLKIDESNSKYFFASMKRRQTHNQIRRLTDADGKLITTNLGIENENSLKIIGISSSYIASIDPGVMPNGYVLDRSQQSSIL